MVSAQFLRFAVAGSIGFVVDSLVLLTMTKVFGLSPFLGRAVSFPAALTTTWLINRSWTFRQAKPKSLREVGAEYLNYWAVQMSGGAVNIGAFAVFVALFGKTGLMQVAAVAAGSVAGMFVNYFGNKALVFGEGGAAARVQRWTQRAAWIAIATLILLIPAFLNGGPFIHFDSEQYFTIGHSIAAALGEIVGIGAADPTAAVQAAPSIEPVGSAPQGAWASAFAGARSPFYGLLLYLTSAGQGLWGIAVPQALIGAWLLSLLSIEFGKGFRPFGYLAMITALTVGSTIGYFANWPMPDVFAGYFLLAALVFVLGERTNLAEKLLLWALMAVGASFHSTINLMAAALAVISVLVLWRNGKRPVAALSAGALILLAIVPGMVGGRIYAAMSEKVAGVPIYSPPFLTARVIGDGTGQRFLKEECPTGRHDFAVCQFSGRTFLDHNHFLWGLPGLESAYQVSDVVTQKRLGEEQIRFVLAVVRAYPGEQVAASAANALQEIPNITIGTDFHTVALIHRDWPDAQILRVAPQYARCLADSSTCGRPAFMQPWEAIISIASM
jgi:putative flippase GtrA